MEKKLQSEFEVPAMEIVTSPQDVGMYCLGDKASLCIMFEKKPNWFHRKMMKMCLGWKWTDTTKK